LTSLLPRSFLQGGRIKPQTRNLRLGGRPIRAGQSFSAAFIVGFFDSIEEMEQVYDRYAGHSGLQASAEGWKLTK